LLKFAGNVAYSAAVRLSSVLEVVLLLEEEEELHSGSRRLWSFAPCALLSALTLPPRQKTGTAHARSL